MKIEKDIHIGILGCGWLGLELGKSLVEKGYNVSGTTTHTDRLKTIEGNGIKPFLVQCDENQISPTEFFDPLDFLFISLPPGVRKNPENRFDQTIETLIHRIKHTDIKKIIFISSTSVYGNLEGEINENSPLKPTTKSGEQLLIAENLILNSDIEQVAIVRFGGLIGPSRHPIFSIAKQGILKQPNGYINLIHLQDCIGILNLLLHSSKRRELINGVTPYHPTRKKYYFAMAELANLTPPKIVKTPGNNRKIKSINLTYTFMVENLLTLS